MQLWWGDIKLLCCTVADMFVCVLVPLNTHGCLCVSVPDCSKWVLPVQLWRLPSGVSRKWRGKSCGWASMLVIRWGSLAMLHIISAYIIVMFCLCKVVTSYMCYVVLSCPVIILHYVCIAFHMTWHVSDNVSFASYRRTSRQQTLQVVACTKAARGAFCNHMLNRGCHTSHLCHTGADDRLVALCVG